MGGHAWVTLATNDSYSLGALVLARSLEQVGTRQQLAVLITPGVTNAMRSKLTEVFDVVQEVNLLDSRDEENLRLLKRPELGVTFTKLHCWRLTQFDKCVFLDADTLVLENCDELFDREELSAAPDIGWPDCFNSGVFVFRPSMETFEKLIRFAIEKGSFDGGDQGLLNLYFSDWAHKDISKHLPFIYNVSSTACYSYLPAFKQFGKTAKIIHFIGASKPWLQYFDTETKKVHASEGLKHLQEILQRWWDLFCTIHSSLSPDMTSHTDTVHGSQSRTFQNTAHISYHHHHVNTPSSHPAVDYQNVWDPWEEYDSRQPQDRHIQNVQSSIPEHTISVSQNAFVMPVCEQVSHSYHSSEIQTHPFEPQSQSFEHKRHSLDHQSQSFEHQNQSFEHQNQSFEHQTQSFEHQNQSFEHQSQSFERQSHSLENRSQSIESHSQHSEGHRHFSENPNHFSGSHSHFSESQNHSTDTHSQQNQLFESHNTNANFDADHHSHNHPPFPTYSQPQTHMSHYEAPARSVQEISHSTKPPPPQNDPIPRLPDECVTTTTVSNEITLQTDSNEDTNENAAGLAGAFAKLTLGAPRTPEQAALDDHLRRQGWEVGNIDYLGRDSFDNIWSKICETLSTAPEQPIATTESPKVEDKSKVVPPTEGAVKSDEKALPEMEDKQKPASVIAQSQVLTESQIPSEAIAESPTEGSEQVEIPKDAKVATETSSTESPPSFAAVVSATITSETTPVETPKPATPVSLISEPTTPTPVPVVPTPETPVAATPAAVSTAPATPAPVAPAPVTPPPAPVTPAVVTPVTVTPTPVTPAPVTPPPVTPASVAPAAATAAPVPTTVETQVHVIPAAVTVAPVTPVPVTPAAEIPATVTPAATPAAVTPAPTTAAATPAPITEAAVVTPAPTTAAATPAPITEAAVTPIPVTPSAVTPPSVTPSAVTPAPVTSAAATPVPVTQAPVAPAPKTPAEVTPLPVTATPVVPAPVTQAAVAAEPVTTVSVSSVPQSPVSVTPSKDTGVVQPATLAKTPIVAVPSSKAADVPLKEVSVPTAGPVAPQSQVPEKSSGPSTPTEAVVLKDPLKTGKISRDPSKKPKEGIQTPKTQVTEPTPPTTPASPQIKDTKPALGVETVVPETPPVPVAESSTAPTPTPRKSNRSDKKTGTKTKK